MHSIFRKNFLSYSVCSNINTEANIYRADGFNGSGRELNHWTSIHCVRPRVKWSRGTWLTGIVQ